MSKVAAFVSQTEHHKLIPGNCCFTKLWRFGDSDFPAFRGILVFKKSLAKKETTI